MLISWEFPRVIFQKWSVVRGLLIREWHKIRQSAAIGQIFNAFLEHLHSTAKSEYEKGELLFELAIRDYLQQSLAIAVWIKNIVVLLKASVCAGD